VHITLADLGHRFADAPFLFRHLDLTLTHDMTYALTGPSGSGKSTLLSLLAGWLRPTEGRVVRDCAARTAWVLQNPHGVARRTALDHVALPFLARGTPHRRASTQARDLLAEFGLLDVVDSPFAVLSGGEAQRLMLARALAYAPDLLLVDEPTAQLDPSTAAVVNQTLNGLGGREILVVIATHDPATRAACTTTIDLSRSTESDSGFSS